MKVLSSKNLLSNGLSIGKTGLPQTWEAQKTKTYQKENFLMLKASSLQNGNKTKIMLSNFFIFVGAKSCSHSTHGFSSLKALRLRSQAHGEERQCPCEHGSTRFDPKPWVA